MEYKQALLVYTKRIAEDGFRGKAEELVKELFGPLYWCVFVGLSMGKRKIYLLARRPGRDDSWTPTLLGFHKRDLLREVLIIFGMQKPLTCISLAYQRFPHLQLKVRR